MSMERFRALCAEHLDPRGMKAVDSLMDPDMPPASRFVAEWRNRETQVRNAVARARAARAKKDASRFLREARGIDVRIERAVEEAMGRQNPMDREIAIDSLRWKLAEELVGFNPFSLDAILSYAVRLNLVLRRTGWKADDGAAALEKIIARSVETSGLAEKIGQTE